MKNSQNNSGWQVIFQNIPEENFWNIKNFNKLREHIYNRFKNSPEKEWEEYKNQNNIINALPKKTILSWEQFFSDSKDNINLKGDTELELEFYNEEEKRVIIKDPLVGISWDYDEPKEGSWISIPEKVAEKLIMMDSFKK